MIKKLVRMFAIGPIVAAILGAAILVGCTDNAGSGEGRESGGATTGQAVSERGGGESGGEHSGGGEGAEGSGGESGEGGAGSEEGSGATLAPDETFDAVRSGARLILGYDAASNSFNGTVENTTNNVLSRVRIEVHLSNGTELGPTTPVGLAPGQVMAVTLPSTQASFTGWIAHAEVGGEHGSGGESGGEHGSGGERRGEG